MDLKIRLQAIEILDSVQSGLPLVCATIRDLTSGSALKLLETDSLKQADALAIT